MSIFLGLFITGLEHGCGGQYLGGDQLQCIVLSNPIPRVLEGVIAAIIFFVVLFYLINIIIRRTKTALIDGIIAISGTIIVTILVACILKIIPAESRIWYTLALSFPFFIIAWLSFYIYQKKKSKKALALSIILILTAPVISYFATYLIYGFYYPTLYKPEIWGSKNYVVPNYQNPVPGDYNVLQ